VGRDSVAQRPHVLHLGLERGVAVTVPPTCLDDELGEGDVDRHVQAPGQRGGSGGPVVGSAGGYHGGCRG
jgi:hypothetical protein